MRVAGQWHVCDDGVTRPVIHGRVLSAGTFWCKATFLVDTGADRTVFSADILQSLVPPSEPAQGQLAGVGGSITTVEFPTQIVLTRHDGGNATFRGVFAACPRSEMLDMSVLGRDILDRFTVIVDREGATVCLLRGNHRYQIVGG